MKRILFSIAAIAAVLGSVVLLSNTDVKTATVEQLTGTDLEKLAYQDPATGLVAASSYYIYPTGATTYEIDTVTNATNDTVTIPVNLLTDRNGAWSIQATNISGTTSIIAIVQESTYLGTTASATDWHEVTRDTFAATGNDWLFFDNITGFKMRLILDGSGTQSTRVQTKFVGKPN